MKKLRNIFVLVLLVALVLPIIASSGEAKAQDPVELRITWYDDGIEGTVLRDLLDRFEAENPDIKVVIDTVPYAAGIQENLPVQLEAGEGPDIARVTNLGGLSQYYLDLRPYLSDPAYWEENFGPYLAWLRPEGDTEGIYGIQNQLTITGPYINRTLFEQAGVEVPSDTSDEVTWEQWAEAARQVAEAVGPGVTAMAMDRSGHRFAGPAVSLGATFFDEEGYPALLEDEGFRQMAELFVGWNQDGTMLYDVWAGATGYAAPNEEFANAQVVFYMSGSWQVPQFANTIGDAFTWEVVPNPCGPGGCTGMPGGAATVAINTTEHPEEVARVMEYLASEEVLREFHARTLFVPAHIGIASTGVEFETDLDVAKAALEMWTAQVPKIQPLAFDLQAYRYNSVLFNAIRDRLTQAITGELSLDDAIARIQEDIDEQLAEAQN